MSQSQGIEVRRPSRRTIAKGAAWAVPVIAIGASAPAFAASGGICIPEFQIVPDGSFKCCNGGRTKNMKVVIQLVDASNCLTPTDSVCVLDVTLGNDQPIAQTVFVPDPPCVSEGNSEFTVYLLDTQSCTVNLLVTFSINGGPAQTVPLKSDNVPGGNLADGTGECIPA